MFLKEIQSLMISSSLFPSVEPRENEWFPTSSPSRFTERSQYDLKLER